MQGRYNDGHGARVRPVEVRIDEDAVRFEVDGEHVAWPMDRLRVERGADYVRLSHPQGGDARLTVALADWSAAGLPSRLGARRGEVRLIAGLAAVALGLGLFVFVGVPALSGPLARATPPAFEEQVGLNYERQLGFVFKDCEGVAGQDALAGLGDDLMARADTPFDIRVRAVEAPGPNAFALPGGTVLVTDDLIDVAETPDELAAVVAHEVAHVEKRHVMQAVWRALGAGLLLDAVVGGGTGAGQQAVLLAGSATEMRYSRDAEAEADARGRELLEAAGYSSAGMGPFFERMAETEKLDDERARAALEFLSSHPDTLRRAKEARRLGKPGRPAMNAKTWATVKAACVKPAKKPDPRARD